MWPLSLGPQRGMSDSQRGLHTPRNQGEGMRERELQEQKRGCQPETKAETEKQKKRQISSGYNLEFKEKCSLLPPKTLE